MAPRALLLLAALVGVLAGPLPPTYLRTESLVSPINIDTALPRFSFQLAHTDRGQSQSAYNIVVRQANGTLVWDSGKVISDRTQNIAYAGSPLSSDADYTWEVTSWDSMGNAGPTSGVATFSTAMLTPAVNFAGADWLGVSAGNMLRATFNLSAAPVRARLYIFGLGAYHAFVNGAPASPSVLFPFTEFEKRVTYDVLDVTRALLPGCNAMGVLLGNGWYSQPSIAVGPRSLMFVLSVTTAGGGTTLFRSSLAASPGGVTFSAAPGPVLKDDVYAGEAVDGRLWQPGWDTCAFSPSSSWTPAGAAASLPPGGPGSYAARVLPITTAEDFLPISITSPPSAPGDFVFDFGQTASYQCTLRLPVGTPAGLTITLSFGEMLHADGTMWNPVASDTPQIASYTTSGVPSPGSDAEVYRTLFVSFGARYAQVSGLPGVPALDALTGHFVHSRVESAGSLVSSSTVVNAIYRATRYSSLSNLADVPTDCPQRERRGWLGDLQLAHLGRVYMHDMAAMTGKALGDIADSQNADGSIPDVAPYYNHGSKVGDPAWSVAYPLVAAWAADLYEDDRVAQIHFAGVARYTESMIARAVAGVIAPGTYGDWGSVWRGLGTNPVYATSDISTYFYIRGLDAAAALALRVGNASAAARYTGIAASARAAYTAAFYSEASGRPSFGDGTPVALVMALDLGGVIPSGKDDAVLATLVAVLTGGAPNLYPGHNSGGIVTTHLIYGVLARLGRSDLAWSLFFAPGEPGYASWAAQGAMSLWESWDTNTTGPDHTLDSLNHIMFSPGLFLTNAAGGIGRAHNASGSGFRKLQLAPKPFPPALTSGGASFASPLGLVETAWAAPSRVPGGLCGGERERECVFARVRWWLGNVMLLIFNFVLFTAV